MDLIYINMYHWKLCGVKYGFFTEEYKGLTESCVTWYNDSDLNLSISRIQWAIATAVHGWYMELKQSSLRRINAAFDRTQRRCFTDIFNLAAPSVPELCLFITGQKTTS